MKSKFLAALLIVAGAAFSAAQSPGPTSPRILASQTSQAPRLPQYLVYRHFLAWIDSLDKQASAANSSDPFKFAEPFAKSAGLSDNDVELLRSEAKTMLADLHNHDQKASAAITAFRVRAKTAVESGQPLPALPDSIRDLQRQRTAVLVHHVVHLQTTLKPATRTSLESYLDREFVAHLSMKHVAVPASRNLEGPANFSTNTRQ